MLASVIKHYRESGLAKTALILVPSGFVMEQTADKLEQFGCGPVGRVGFGYAYRPDREIQVAIVDSAYRSMNSEHSPWVTEPDMLLLDEAHHARAMMWSSVCSACQAKYRWAYTATVHDDPKKYSYSDLLLFGLIGPVIFEIRSKELRDRGHLAYPLVTMIKPKTGKIPVWGWRPVYNAGIVNNKVRNSLITSIAQSCYDGGYKSLIFVGRKEQGHKLANRLAMLGTECLFVHGGATVWQYLPSGARHQYTWSIKELADYVNDRDRAAVITTQVMDEGVDIPIINVLIMGTGMKKYRRTIQRAGRGMRPKKGNNRVFIFDFWDENHKFLESQSEYRMWTYREEEYEISSSLEYTEEVMGIRLNIERELFLKEKRR
jgi:superfamily II DNA or RNA helicase